MARKTHKDPTQPKVSHWKTPKEGYYVSNRELISHAIATMGLGGWGSAGGAFSFAGTAIITGMIYHIKLTDIAVITAIGTIIGFLKVPVNAYITDNMGILPKKIQKIFGAATAGILALCGLLWLLPSTWFSGVVPDLFKHIAVELLIFVVVNALTLVTLRLFGKKYGKFKPFMIFWGPFVLVSALGAVWLPYESMRYSILLLWIHLFSKLFSEVSVPHMNFWLLGGRMSPNSDERSKIMSIVPVFTGLLRNVYQMAFPFLAGQFFGGVQNIGAYRWVMPAYGILCSVMGLLELRVQERVYEAKDHVASIKLVDAAKSIFSNKYLWITNLGTVLGFVGNVSETILVYLLLYGTRMEWLSGILVALYKLFTSFTGNLSAQFFMRRFSKRTVKIGLQFIMMFLTGGMLLVLAVPETMANYALVQIVIFMIFCSLNNYFNAMGDTVNFCITADIWDYQQWKTGERLESSTNLFTYFSAPLTILFGFILPYLSRLFGLVGNTDVLFDQSIRNNIILVTVVLSVICKVLSALPFIFYDLSPAKLKGISRDLQVRAGLITEEEAEQP